MSRQCHVPWSASLSHNHPPPDPPSRNPTHCKHLCRHLCNVPLTPVVYQVPPRTSATGYKAADWNVETFLWKGRLRVVEIGDKCELKLEVGYSSSCTSGQAVKLKIGFLSSSSDYGYPSYTYCLCFTVTAVVSNDLLSLCLIPDCWHY